MPASAPVPSAPARNPGVSTRQSKCRSSSTRISQRLEASSHGRCSISVQINCSLGHSSNRSRQSCTPRAGDEIQAPTESELGSIGPEGRINLRSQIKRMEAQLAIQQGRTARNQKSDAARHPHFSAPGLAPSGERRYALSGRPVPHYLGRQAKTLNHFEALPIIPASTHWAVPPSVRHAWRISRGAEAGRSPSSSGSGETRSTSGAR